MYMAFALLTIFCTSFVIALSGALMPGPLMTVTVTESSRRGASVGPLMILGHAILELGLVIGLLFGLGTFLGRDDVFVFISLVGGAVLLWMGISMLRSLPGLSFESTAQTEKPGNLVLAGIVLSAVNPYWFIWWASIGLGYITQSFKFGLIGVISFFLGHILADLSFYAFISLAVARGKNVFSDRMYRKLIGGCGIFLIFFSCWFFYSGIDKFSSFLT
jgi:threonine/homoserine/homoserine lactone efflux protein